MQLPPRMTIHGHQARIIHGIGRGKQRRRVLDAGEGRLTEMDPNRGDSVHRALSPPKAGGLSTGSETETELFVPEIRRYNLTDGADIFRPFVHEIADAMA